MGDDIQMTHRHDKETARMRPVDENRIDGLVVREFACDCGYGAAVLSRIENEEPGGSWPFAFGRRRELA